MMHDELPTTWECQTLPNPGGYVEYSRCPTGEDDLILWVISNEPGHFEWILEYRGKDRERGPARSVRDGQERADAAAKEYL